MLNHLASLVMSTRVLKALPGKLDIKRHSPSILYILLFLQAGTSVIISSPVTNREWSALNGIW